MDAGLLGDVLILIGAFSLGFAAGVALGPLRSLYAGIGRAPGRLLQGTQTFKTRMRQAIGRSPALETSDGSGHGGRLAGGVANLLTLRVRRAEESFREGCVAFDRADVARARRKLVEALFWDRKVELRPLHVRAHLHLGWLDEQLADWARAKGHYARAVTLDKGNLLATVRLGMMHFRLGETGQAIFQLQHALELDPTNLDTHYCLYAIYRQASMGAESLEQLRILKAGESAQELSGLFARHGEVSFRLGRYSEAIADYSLALQFTPSRVCLYTALGDLYYLRQQAHAAVDVWCRGLWAGYSDALAERVLAVAGGEVGYLSIIQLMRDSVVRHRLDGRYHKMLSQLLLSTGEEVESLALLEESARLSPQLPEAHQMLGDRYAEVGQQAKAARTYRTALAAVRAQETVFCCRECGYVTREEQERCFQCHQWGTLQQARSGIGEEQRSTSVKLSERATALRRQLTAAWSRAVKRLPTAG